MLEKAAYPTKDKQTNHDEPVELTDDELGDTGGGGNDSSPQTRSTEQHGIVVWQVGCSD